MQSLYSEYLKTIPSLEEKTIAITGTTSGTGFYTAVCAVRKNAKKVLLLNRNSERADRSLKELTEEKEKSGSSTELIPVECDLMSLEIVRSAADQVNTLCTEGLDVLINNAGIMAMPDRRTKDGFDIQMQVNHLSHFLLTHLVLPSLIKSADQGKEVRIVQHSSGARRGPSINEKYFRKADEKTLGGDGMIQCFLRYHQTKLANSAFAMILEKKLQETKLKGKIKSVVAEPGISDTDLVGNLRSTHEAYNSYGWTTSVFLGGMTVLAKLGLLKFQPPEDGATPLIKAAFGENVDGGDFYVPEYRTYGAPIKIISKAKEVLKGWEKNTMNTENQEKVWNTSEESLGIQFFSNL
eukprot:snap_masked-scaffold_10-processed-gene-8.31-mRNA-1 protein AED:0.11 eAED:0.12 QI:0/-1/0/1/-1/1/1/0/351